MFKDISDENFNIIEIYPKIYVYKDLFPNVEEIYSMLKNFDKQDEENFFPDWSKWSYFGEYLPVPGKFSQEVEYSGKEKYKNFDKIKTTTESQKKQQDFVISLIDKFYSITQDYTKKHNIDIDETLKIATYDGFEHPAWHVSGPNICKHDTGNKDHPGGMSYHSDFVRERSEYPGDQFVITGLAYFNDDYEGGEIDFVIGKNMIKYKPEAGDYIVFPSGHPDFLTENGNVYLHGVMPSKKTNKYFSRIYWVKYYYGSDIWHENEKKYGKEVWLKMQKELEENFKKANQQRTTIEDGIRLA